MRSQHPASLCFALILLALFSNPAHALGFLTFYPIEIEANLRYNSSDKEHSNSEDTSNNLWETGIRIAQDAYYLDPAIARFKLEVEPVYTWGKFDSGSIEEDRNGDLLSYLLQINLLQGTPGPYGFDFLALRTSNLNTGSLGNRYNSVIDNKSAAMQWKNSSFPIRFTIEDKQLEQDFFISTNNTVSRRDEHLQVFKVKGKSSKLDVNLEHQILDDRVSERNQDYNLDLADISHRLEWGHNSELLSRFNYFDRTGFNGFTRISLDETARIKHTENISSQSSYRFFSVEQDVKSDEHSADIEILHRLYSNLTTSGRLFTSRLTSQPLDINRWRTGLTTKYNKNDFFNASVNAELYYSYQETERDSRQGVADVVDEIHMVSLSGSMILKRRFVIPATVIVTSQDGAQVYTEGFDYAVEELAEDLTQVQAIPGGQIDSGETILISYKATVLPSQEFSTTFTRYSLGFDLGWMRFSHYSNESDDSLLSGAGESFLNDNKDVVTDLEFKWQVANFDTLFSAERRFNQIGKFKRTTYTYQQLLSWVSNKGTLWNLNLNESFSETETRTTDTYNLELSASWRPFYSLSIRPVIGVWKRDEIDTNISNDTREDEYLSGALNLRWHYRKMALDFNYQHNRRTVDTRETKENRVMFNLRRRF